MWYTHYLLLLRNLQITYEADEFANAIIYSVDELIVSDARIGEESPICRCRERHILILVIGIKIFAAVRRIVQDTDCGFCHDNHLGGKDHADDREEDGDDLDNDTDDAEQSFHSVYLQYI